VATFLQLQDRVLARTTQSSTEARTRVKGYINRRLRRIATSNNCGRVRQGTVSINTVAGTATITTTGLVKVHTVRIPTQNRVLDERTLDQMRLLDPDDSRDGVPQFFAVQGYNAATCTVRLLPIPDAVYAVSIDGILSGTELSADGDIPGLPEDFHDLLESGAIADEFKHLRQLEDAMVEEQVWKDRLSELKMWLAKSKWLSNVDKDREWWMVTP
jgi:hypothetical protein